MEPNLFTYKQESCHVIPHVITHAMNTNDVMCASCAMHPLASQPSLDTDNTLEVTYWHAIHMSQTTITKINCFTFS